MCKYIKDSSTYCIHTGSSCTGTHTPLVSLVQSPLQKPLSHRNQRARRGIKAVYIMKLKELLRVVSLTAPRKAFLLLQRIEERKKKKREKKIPPNNTAQQQRQQQQSVLRKRRHCENEREREAIERLFILSQPRVPTENVLK